MNKDFCKQHMRHQLDKEDLRFSHVPGTMDDVCTESKNMISRLCDAKCDEKFELRRRERFESDQITMYLRMSTRIKSKIFRVREEKILFRGGLTEEQRIGNSNWLYKVRSGKKMGQTCLVDM